MLKFFLNTTTGEWFNQDGDPFRNGKPAMPFQSRDEIQITICSETPDAGDEGVNVENWTRDTSFANISGISAVITCDNDYIHKLKGATTQEISAGEISSISAEINGATIGKIPDSGVLRIFSANGEYESFAYSSRAIDGSVVVFAVSGSATNSYASGSTIDCDQSPFCSAFVDQSKSDFSEGILSFDFTVDSNRLREEMNYSDTAVLDVAGLELLIYKTTESSNEKICSFLCETFRICGTLGNLDYEAAPPDEIINELNAIVQTLAAAGFDVETNELESGDVQFRFRLSAAGGDWSAWITLPRGEDGEPGIPGAIITDALEIPFETTAETGETIVLSSEQLGIEGKCEFDLIDAGGFNVSADSRLRRRWTDSGYELSFTGGWPVASWILKPRGIKGADGEPGPDRNPVVEFTVADPDFGRCVWLSEATPLLTFADRVYGARTVRMLIVSGDTTLPGNAVLIPVVAGVEQSPVTVSAGVEPAWVEISLGDSGISGSLAFRRDYESSEDTLSGEGAVVALVVLALEVHYA